MARAEAVADYEAQVDSRVLVFKHAPGAWTQTAALVRACQIFHAVVHFGFQFQADDAGPLQVLTRSARRKTECTASRARAVVKPKGQTFGHGQTGPHRPTAMRAAVNRRSSVQGSSVTGEIVFDRFMAASLVVLYSRTARTGRPMACPAHTPSVRASRRLVRFTGVSCPLLSVNPIDSSQAANSGAGWRPKFSDIGGVVERG